MTSGGLFYFFFFLCFIIPTEEGLTHAVFVWERNFAFSSSLQLLFFKHITCFPIAYFMYQISFHFSHTISSSTTPGGGKKVCKKQKGIMHKMCATKQTKTKCVRKQKKKLFYKKHAPIHHSSHKQLLESHFIPPPPRRKPHVQLAIFFYHFRNSHPVVAEGFVGVIGV